MNMAVCSYQILVVDMEKNITWFYTTAYTQVVGDAHDKLH